MGDIKNPEPVKYFCGLLTSYLSLIDEVRARLEESISPVDITCGPMDWNFTSYYETEMGPGLKRYFFSFKVLRSPLELSLIKIRTNSIENEFAVRGFEAQRPVNLDPGYINAASMILASTKPYAHRVYIGGGIYAQVDYLFKEGGKIEFTPWVYPDYKTKEYCDFFLSIRKKYLEDIKREV